MTRTYFIVMLLISGITGIFSIPVSAQDTQGFFLNDFKPKKAIIPQYIEYLQPTSKATVSVTINIADPIAKVSSYLFGNNANTYMTNMVDQPDLIKHIRTLSPNIIRYPGGNLSNIFFWNAAPGNKPSDVPDTIQYGDKRKVRAESFYYGMNESPATLSIDNYYKMLQMTNSTGIICVNYGYARYGTSPHPVQQAAHYAADWVRYDKGRTKFWEIGNEDYGPWQAGYAIDTTKNHDGQPRLISGKLYGTQFKVFADSMRAAAREIHSEIHIGAVMIEAPKQTRSGEIEKGWNDGILSTAGNAPDFNIIHCYYTPYQQNTSAEMVLASAKRETDKMISYMKDLSKEKNMIQKPVALTEWNIFAVGSMQSCSYISGMHAAIVLGEMAKTKYGMASRWDFANGYAKGNDHGLFSKGDEPGVPRWNPRPAYYYLYYFEKFFGDHIVSTGSTNDSLLVYASTYSSGEVGIVMINTAKSPHIVKLNFTNFKPGKKYYLYSLTGGTDNGEFSQQVFVNGIGPDIKSGGPKNIETIKALSATIKKELVVDSPSRSIQYILVEKK